jgi:hypothetical protein
LQAMNGDNDEEADQGQRTPRVGKDEGQSVQWRSSNAPAGSAC